MSRGGPLRRRGRPRRPGHLLLPRRARLAVVLPLDDRAQHRRARRAEPVRRRRSLPVAAARERPGDRRHGHRGNAPSGPRSTTATCRSTRRPGTGARSGWTGRRAASTSSTRSTAAATTSGSPSTSAPRLQAELDGDATRCCSWPRRATPGAARLALPPQLRWSLHRGETDPDPRLVLARSGPAGARVHAARPRALHSIRVFCHTDRVPGGKTEKMIVKQSDVSETGQISAVEDVPGIRAEAG